MAPIITKRSSIPSRTSNSTRRSALKAAPENSHAHHRPSGLFPSTKDDKRRMKHSSLISRIEKANSKTNNKRRRPSKKLVANLESLISALPDVGNSRSETIADSVRIKHKSLKSRPGAMKKKEKLEKMETDRFSKNLAQMAATTPDRQGSLSDHDPAAESSAGADSSPRWAALRSFIQATMDRDPTA